MRDFLRRGKLETGQVHNYEEKYGIPMTEELKEEVMDMCNFSDGIEERGLKRGRREGRQEAILQGIRNAMKNLGIPAEEAMRILGVPQKENEKYLKILSGN